MKVGSVGQQASVEQARTNATVRSHEATRYERAKRTSSVPPPMAMDAPPPNISKPAQLFGKLKDLATKDPGRFGEITGRIAVDLRDAAAKTDGEEATFLNKLADRFAEASTSHDMSSLQPPRARGNGPAAGHHHGHPHGARGPESDAVRAIFQGAIDAVDQALAASAIPPPTAGDAPAASNEPATVA